jgi:hypothetical protein
MSKSPKQLAYCLKRAETSVVLIFFDVVLCVIHVYTITVFVTVTQYDSDTRKTIYLGHVTTYSKQLCMTTYSKKLYSQCNLTAQIEQVQDKYIYLTSYKLLGISLV